MRLHVVDGLGEDIHRLGLDSLRHGLDGIVEHALRLGLGAIVHDLVDDLRRQLGPVAGIRLQVDLGGLVGTGHDQALGRLVPYFERERRRSSTPEASSQPRNTW